MKTLALFLIILMAGCATASFDNKELEMATNIRYLSSQTQACDNPLDASLLAKQLYSQSQIFAMYAEHIPHNSEVIKMIDELVKDTEPFDRAYTADRKPSTAYCKNKLEIVNHSANRVQRSIAIKIRK